MTLTVPYPFGNESWIFAEGGEYWEKAFKAFYFLISEQFLEVMQVENGREIRLDDLASAEFCFDLPIAMGMDLNLLEESYAGDDELILYLRDLAHQEMIVEMLSALWLEQESSFGFLRVLENEDNRRALFLNDEFEGVRKELVSLTGQVYDHLVFPETKDAFLYFPPGENERIIIRGAVQRVLLEDHQARRKEIPESFAGIRGYFDCKLAETRAVFRESSPKEIMVIIRDDDRFTAPFTLGRFLTFPSVFTIEGGVLSSIEEGELSLFEVTSGRFTLQLLVEST